MSLINHMLRDLELRRGGARVTGPEILEGLDAASAAELGRPAGWRRAGWGIVALMLVAGVAAAHLSREAPVLPPEPASPPSLTVPVHPSTVSGLEPGPTPAELVGVQVLKEDGQIRLRVELSRAVDYRLRQSTEPPALELLLPDSRLAPGFGQRLDAADLISGVEIAAADGGLLLRFALRQGVRIESGEWQAGAGQARLELALAAEDPWSALLEQGLLSDLMVAPAASPPAEARQAGAAAAGGPGVSMAAAGELPDAPAAGAPQFERTLREPAGPERAEQIYQGALAHLRRGDEGRAGELLAEALALYPAHLGARLARAAHLSRRGEAAAAEALLREGLAQHPGDVRLAKPLARLLADRGAAGEALEALETAAVSGAGDAEYHGFVAALQQRQGRHAEAVKGYGQALRIRPEEGIWWMGLAISLAGEGRSGEALQAYRRALADASLSANLRRYIAERIAGLEGGPG